ncbi:hypothetical protein KSB_54140 [Ktedonobacter robiniae]|uniref:Uncharacterized protein n=1 Tax=Ktedonobacter robiniae TaxID=2778365 RepID=A0ABQ3UVS5_9CHLR|nr:hypothetical protein KSB_54140 [Ktedonobacter robiniae]
MLGISLTAITTLGEEVLDVLVGVAAGVLSPVAVVAVGAALVTVTSGVLALVAVTVGAFPADADADVEPHAVSIAASRSSKNMIRIEFFRRIIEFSPEL